MAQRFDAVIIGGGHNGLVTSAYLAARGLKVLVLERRPYVGGASVTEEPWPGYRVSTAAYVISLLRPELARELDLKRHGLVVYPQDPPYFQPYPDGRSLMIWNDYATTREEIRKFSVRDAQVYEEYEATLNRLAEFVEPLLLMTPPNPTSSRARDLLGMLRAARLGRGLKKDLFREIEILVGSAKDFLDSWFESEELKALLCGQAVIGTFAGPRTPGTAYVLFHHVMGEVDGMRGCWGVVRGGMGQVSECIARAARERGVVIRTGAPVERILVKDGRAEGVVLKGGEEVRARAVVSNADPKITFTKLLDARRELPPEFARAVERFRASGSSVKVNYALAELPDFTALPGKRPGPQHRGTIDICPTLDYMERGYADYRTPVRGLYMCGACTHPGGGVMGAAGRNAAREILRDWKRGRFS